MSNKMWFEFKMLTYEDLINYYDSIIIINILD